MSPQLSPNHPSIETSLKDPAFSDPYLSAPLDPDEAAFQSSAIRLTPVPDDIPAQHTIHDASSPCLSTQPDTSSVSVLSPGEELLSNPSIHDSPNADYGMMSLNINVNPAELNDWQPNPTTSHERHGLDSVQSSSPQSVMPSAQLLSPIFTDNPSPSSDMEAPSFFPPDSDALLSPEGYRKQSTLLPPLITSPISDSLSVNAEPESRARSPIVMVESVSRGDSPVRGANPFRRPSSAYLSPGGVDSDDDMGDDQSSIFRAEDGSWVRDTTTGQAGVDPTCRGDALVPSPNEMETHRHLVEKNTNIHNWTASVSAATSEVSDDNFLAVRGRGDRPAGNHRRAKSTGDPSLQQDYFNFKSRFDNLSIPGPGVLVQESSDYGAYSEFESGSVSDSPVASVFQTRDDEMDHGIPPSEPNPDYEEPLPSQFLRARPWQDPAQDPSPKTSKMQPNSSSAAMMEFQRRARELDRASWMATWGTRDLGDAEVKNIIGGDSIGKLTIDTEQAKSQERRSSLRSLFPRASSPLKRQRSEMTLNNQVPNNDDVTNGQSRADLQRKTSMSSHRRKLSIGRSRSPSVSAGGAMAAMAGTMAAVGGGKLSPGTPKSRVWTRQRSKSEVPMPPAPGLVDLMTTFGGPPVASAGFLEKARQPDPEPVANDVGGEDDEDDEEGMVMEFPVQSRLPVPTLEGFKTQITQLNPRLASALLDRLANEQLRRYKKLVEQKLSHARTVGSHSCVSGNYCFGQGGEAKILPPRTSARDSDVIQTQFHIPGNNATHDDPQNFGEGTVTAAQFPPGVPMPPVQRLPAEFECPICFKVKKFQKPSDWSKHVHEDVQPFTCTFPRCNEPKSFKRKADWVRHESERHRQLEWWTCTVPDCHHTCYRKDNFVQHLIREHKMPEPKAKKGNKTNSLEEIQRDREIQQLWELVDDCRHETTKNPREEPCRFCGNVCNSWKKLTVHLAKHMEQIALPVLGLVRERDSGPTHTNSSPAAISSTIAFGHGDDLSSNPVPFNPTYPPPSFTTTQDGFLSAEPETMNPYEEMTSQKFLHPGVEQHSSLHQNSVSYPPPFNAVPRPLTPNTSNHSDANSVIYSPNPITVSSAKMEPVYDSQGPMVMSPMAEGEYPYPDVMGTSLSYYSGAARHIQNHHM